MNILLIVSVLATIFVAILIPIYWRTYGLANFLWLSDIGLFITVLALWFHSSLLISIASILILPLEIIWIIDFFYKLITRRNLLNIVNYMYNSNCPLLIRALSLFHVFLPGIWIICLYFWGYNPHAFWWAVVLLWLVLLLTYFFTEPKDNINWVHLPVYQKWRHISGYLWLMLLLIGLPVCIIFPMHLLLSRFF